MVNETLEGGVSRFLRPQQASAATTAMIALAERLREAAVREDALVAALTAYVETYGPLPSAHAAFHAVIDPEVKAEAKGRTHR